MAATTTSGQAPPGKDLYYYEHKGGQHHESSWAARVHLPLAYLFPWESSGGRSSEYE